MEVPWGSTVGNALFEEGRRHIGSRQEVLKSFGVIKW